MGIWGGIKGIGRGIGSAVSRPVRGIGRMMRGNFREGLGDIGFGIKRGAQAAALLGSGGTLAPLMAAGGAMLERGTAEGAGIGNVLRSGVGGASGAMAARGAGNIGRSMLNRGAQSAGQSVAGQVAAGQSVAGQVPSAVPPLAGAEMMAGTEAAGSGIGRALSAGAGWMEEHPASVTFAGNVLGSTGYDQGDYYRDMVRMRREEEEYDRSQENMLRQLVVSGAWRSR